MVAFGFGLVHGFGFAGVMAEMELDRESVLSALLSFNLGVESGQLAIVSVFLPAAFSARRAWFYQKLILFGGSVLIAGVAFLWMIERACEVTLLGTQ